MLRDLNVKLEKRCFILTGVWLRVNLNLMAGFHIGELFSVGLQEGGAGEQDLGVNDVELDAHLLDVCYLKIEQTLVLLTYLEGKSGLLLDRLLVLLFLLLLGHVGIVAIG